MSKNKSSKPSEFQARRNELQAACDSIYRLAVSMGYSREDATIMRNTKYSLFNGELRIFKTKMAQRDKIKLGLLLPLGSIMTVEEWFSMPREARDEALWNAGLDVKDFNYVEDVMCTTASFGKFCGFCVYGQERIDDEWCNKVDSNTGQLIASLEAQLANRDDYEFSKDIRRLN